MRTAQELRAAADLLCSEIEENQILFSYYEFTEEEQEVILGHFIEYLNSKKHAYIEAEGFIFKNYESILSFNYLNDLFYITLSYAVGFWVSICQKGLPAIRIARAEKENIAKDPAQAEAALKLYLDSCVFKNHLKTTA